MKLSPLSSHSKGYAKTRKKTREELDQEARDRKRQRKHRGHAPGNRTADGNTTPDSKGQNAPKGPHIDGRTPILSGVTERVTKQYKPKSEKPMFSPQAELRLLETDERLDALLERLETDEALSAEEQSWVDAKLDRIDGLAQKLGLPYDDDGEEEEDEKQEDMVRLPWGN